MGFVYRHATKCGAGRICRADLIGDNLRIYRVYLRISDYCRVTVMVRVRVRFGLGLGIWLELGLGLVLGLALGLGLLIVAYKLLEK